MSLRFREGLKKLEGRIVLEGFKYKETKTTNLVKAWCPDCHKNHSHGLLKETQKGHMEERAAHCGKSKDSYFVVYRGER